MWRRSGLGAHAFCRGRGISAASLYRWSREVGPTTLAVGEEALRLVEAVVEPAATTTPEVWSWELTGPRGTLRVHGPITESALRVVLGAVLEGRER